MRMQQKNRNKIIVFLIFACYNECATGCKMLRR